MIKAQTKASFEQPSDAFSTAVRSEAFTLAEQIKAIDAEIDLQTDATFDDTTLLLGSRRDAGSLL